MSNTTTKASTIFTRFLSISLSTILFTIFFALLSACGGGGSDKKSDSASGSTDPVADKPVEEPAPDPLFRSTWRVPENSKTITLPLVENYNYNFTVDWGDGNPISEITAHDDMDKKHTYEAEGDYNLVIEGTLEAWSFNNDNTGDKDKILSVENFGDLGYKNLSGAFHGCTNLGAFEGGVTSDVTDMTSMFNGATAANPDVSEWDFSSVTNMTSMFDDSALSIANYDAFLINLADNNVSVEDVTLGATGIYYYSDDAKTARDTLESDRGWTITDAGDAAIFRSTWRVTADDKDITLPLVDDAAYTYDFTVDWGDGSSSTIKSFGDTAKTHTYENEGDYKLVIEGILEAWSFNSAGDKDKIFSVESFGDLDYKNLFRAFYDCANLSAFEGGITSGVTNMRGMFRGATSADPDVSNWDVSKVTDMRQMFFGATSADPDVSNWDVSKVTNMRYMFSGATSVDPDVSSWNVFSVTDMTGVFSGATSADPDVSEWDVSSVTDMRNMFDDATSADPDVSEWDVSSVTDMRSMFRDATSADPNVSSWVVSAVTDMENMFRGATSADPDVSEWDVSAVTNMRSMFRDATSADPDVSNWDVSAVTGMHQMFNESGFSTANYDAFLINLADNNDSVMDVRLGVKTTKYSSDDAKTARDTLESDRGWTITDAGDATPAPTPAPTTP